MERRTIQVLAAFVLILIGLRGIAWPVVQGSTAVVVGLALITGGLIGGIIGYWLGQSKSNLVVVYQQYRDDVGAYTREVMLLYRDSYDKMAQQMKSVHATFVNKTYNYYVRWAESIASSVCGPDKATITDDDLAPLVNDLVAIVENYVTFVLNSLYDLYRKGQSLAEMRRSAGISPTRVLFAVPYMEVDYEGRVCVIDQCARLSRFIVKPLGWVAAGGSMVISRENISMMITGKSVIDVRVLIETDVGLHYVEGYGGVVVLADFLKSVIRDLSLIYYHSKVNADIYCSLISLGEGSLLPPPSIALPIDINDLDKLDPQARMMLYLTYLQMLSELDWSKISELTPENVTIVDKMTRIEGCVDRDFDGEYELCGGFFPFAVPFQLYFEKGGVWGIAGYSYALINNSVFIIFFPVTSGDQIPSEISAVKLMTPSDYPYSLYNVSWADPVTGIEKRAVGIDLNGDSKVDYIMPPIRVDRIVEVAYNPEKGEYEEREVLELRVGPQTVKFWVMIVLQMVTGLPSPTPTPSFNINKLKEWWSSLDFKMKLAIIVGVLVVLVVLVMAAGGSRVVVVGRR